MADRVDESLQAALTALAKWLDETRIPAVIIGGVATEPWRSDVKRFRSNAAKRRRVDEQIYCIPAEEMTYQDIAGTGNVID